MEKFGIISFVLSCLINGLIIYKTMEFTRNNGITSYQEMINKKVKNAFFANTIHIIITIFLVIGFIVMTAGFGAYFKQELGMPNILGCTILCLLCTVALRKKSNGIIKVNEICMPLLMLLLICLSIEAGRSINSVIPKALTTNYTESVKDLILYASYNSIGLIPILVILNRMTNSKRKNICVSIISTSILIILGIAVFKLIWGIDDMAKAEIPMLVIAKKLGNFFSFFYGIIILISMYTSAISNCYGFLENTPNFLSDNIKILLLCGISIAVSKSGFANLIYILYPAFGYLGTIQMFFILIT